MYIQKVSGETKLTSPPVDLLKEILHDPKVIGNIEERALTNDEVLRTAWSKMDKAITILKKKQKLSITGDSDMLESVTRQSVGAMREGVDRMEGSSDTSQPVGAMRGDGNLMEEEYRCINT